MWGYGRGPARAPEPDDVTSVPKIRILVVGDTGTGRSSFLRALCEGKASQTGVPSTIGCNVEVYLYESKSGPVFVEFYDVSGSLDNEAARSVFYTYAKDGLMLVYDMTNLRSMQNLRAWSRRVFGGNKTMDFQNIQNIASSWFSSKSASASMATLSGGRFSLSEESSRLDEPDEEDAPAARPVLIVGCKKDQAPRASKGSGSGRYGPVDPKMIPHSLASKFGCDIAMVNGVDPQGMKLQHDAMASIRNFFDKVLEFKKRRETHPSGRVSAQSSQSAAAGYNDLHHSGDHAYSAQHNEIGYRSPSSGLSFAQNFSTTGGLNTPRVRIEDSRQTPSNSPISKMGATNGRGGSSGMGLPQGSYSFTTSNHHQRTGGPRKNSGMKGVQLTSSLANVNSMKSD
eukprot:Clim_evm37s136 gene=Clim_evmTU37s136